MPNSVVTAYLFGLLALCVAGLVTFDRLVQLQRRNHPEEWERDGKPWHGFGVGGGAAWKQCSIAWLFSTADWMRMDKNAVRLVTIYRGLWLSFSLGLVAGILYRV